MSYRKRKGIKSFADQYGELEQNDDFLRRGDLYEILKTHPIADAVLAGDMTIGEGAATLGAERTAFTRALAAVTVDRRLEAGLIPQLDEQMVRGFLGDPDTEIPDPQTPEYGGFLDRLVDAFVAFRDEFFETRTTRGRTERFVNKGYHRTWIRATLHAIFTGSQQMILSPPRHGKSELMVHFCVWLIVRNPDTRIMWVAKNDDMAEQMIGAVKDHLQHNTKLIEAFLGEEGRYKPRSGGWARLRFQVATRTVVGQKSFTMIGVGWTGTILSRDVDFMVLDDVLDDRNTMGPTQRESNRHKLVTAIDSRNEDHTAFLIIGSRQHWDDFYGYLIDDPNWNTIVEQAHDDLCDIDPHDIDDHIECMLWPERHPYRWWYSKWQSQRRMGLEHLFEMVYQNRPRPSGKVAFRREDLVRALNRERRLGDLQWFDDNGILSRNLVAGLDPAAVGHQAAWLWLYDFEGNKIYMLDAENPRGGGIDSFLELVMRWHAQYQLVTWVVETNNVQRLFLDDPRVRQMAGELGIGMQPHSTYNNRLDKEFGVPSMAHWYGEDMVDLPYGDQAAQDVVDAFTRQAVNFDPNVAGKQHRPVSDLLMASWFPIRIVRGWMATVTQHEVQWIGYQPSYPEYDQVSVGVGGEMPW